MPDIIGTDFIELHPGTVDYPVDFYLKAASATNVNDGTIPFGTTILSATGELIDDSGTVISTLTVTKKDDYTLTCKLSYPSGAITEGKYTIKLLVTLDTGMKLPVYARRVYVYT